MTIPIQTKFNQFSKHLLICVPLIIGLTFCSERAGQSPPIELLKSTQQTKLRIGTLLSPLTYFPTGEKSPFFSGEGKRREAEGFDYELVKQFTQSLQADLQIKVYHSTDDLFKALRANEVDIIAAGLVYDQQQATEFQPSPTYYYSSQQLIYRQGNPRPASLEDLSSQVIVANNINPNNLFMQMNYNSPSAKPSWYKSEILTTQDLLIAVAEGHLDYTVADPVTVAFLQHFYPQLSVAFTLNEKEPVVWYTRRDSNSNLSSLITEFFTQIVEDGTMARLKEKYLSYVGTFDYVDTRAFLRAIDHTLPSLQPLFEKYSDQIDWQLLAAVAYQESHWNPTAISPTGVRGIMMLTNATADEMGVNNRNDPEQSIRGGAQYLQLLMDKVPESVHDDERVWFALAAYNMGLGHMLDARELTRKQGANPDSWVDVKQRLPLLAKRTYYQQTRYGYARGHEAYQFVENIRRYILSLNGYLAKQRQDGMLFAMYN